MILANYTQQNRNCVRDCGAAFSNPFGQFKAQLIPSFYVPDTALPGLDYSAFNNGYNTEKAWQLPLKSGGVAAGGVGGSGSMAGVALAVKLALADLTGTGSLDAIGSLIVQAVAALTGTGTISSAALSAFLDAVAALTGSGGATGPATGVGTAIAAVTGSGGASGPATGVGAVSADLTVTGTGLSTANVGQAVWDYILSCGYTAEQAMQILTAVAAGKSDITDLGGGLATVIFRDLQDTRDVVDADMTGSERTTVTLDP